MYASLQQLGNAIIFSFSAASLSAVTQFGERMSM